MERPITGFERDEEGHWVARLSCGHGQHVRHEPPFHDRAWTTTEEGREEKLGLPLDCLRCDRRELPEAARHVRRTPTFTEESVPAGLLRDHRTKRGTWGLIHVEQGELEYRIDEPASEVLRLVPGRPGVVVPEMAHRVRPLGEVRFHVEFLARPAEPEGA